MRNILFNGAMEIDQFNEGANVPLASGTDRYICDGWVAGFNSASAVVSAQRVADGPTGFNSSMKITVGTGAPIVSGDYLGFHQAIEALELIDLGFGASGAKDLHVSFWAKSSIADYTMAYTLLNTTLDQTWIGNVTIANANEWERFTGIISGGHTGAWTTNGTGIGAYLRFGFAAGSDFIQAPGLWGSTNAVGTPYTSNGALETSGATVQVAGAKLAVDTSLFSRGSADQLISRCERYLTKSYDIGVMPGNATSNGASLLGNKLQEVRFAAPMRVTPSITLNSPVTGASGKGYDYVNSVDVPASVGAQVGTRGFYWYAVPSAGDAVEIGVHFVADARLP